jgi:hypothetical protein
MILAIINSISQLIIVMEMHCVFCDVETELIEFYSDEILVSKHQFTSVQKKAIGQFYQSK